MYNITPVTAFKKKRQEYILLNGVGTAKKEGRKVDCCASTQITQGQADVASDFREQSKSEIHGVGQFRVQ
jgi:hypothetical protein